MNLGISRDLKGNDSGGGLGGLLVAAGAAIANAASSKNTNNSREGEWTSKTKPGPYKIVPRTDACEKSLMLIDQQLHSLRTPALRISIELFTQRNMGELRFNARMLGAAMLDRHQIKDSPRLVDNEGKPILRQPEQLISPVARAKKWNMEFCEMFHPSKQYTKDLLSEAVADQFHAGYYIDPMLRESLSSMTIKAPSTVDGCRLGIGLGHYTNSLNFPISLVNHSHGIQSPLAHCGNLPLWAKYTLLDFSDQVNSLFGMPTSCASVAAVEQVHKYFTYYTLHPPNKKVGLNSDFFRCTQYVSGSVQRENVNIDAMAQTDLGLKDGFLRTPEWGMYHIVRAEAENIAMNGVKRYGPNAAKQQWYDDLDMDAQMENIQISIERARKRRFGDVITHTSNKLFCGRRIHDGDLDLLFAEEKRFRKQRNAKLQEQTDKSIAAAARCIENNTQVADDTTVELFALKISKNVSQQTLVALAISNGYKFLRDLVHDAECQQAFAGFVNSFLGNIEEE